MSKPDVIVVQPSNVDFPLFRYQIRKYREYYNKVIIVFSESFGAKYNFTGAIKFFMGQDNITFIDSIVGGGDWRHNSVQAARKCIESENVLFLEQDFIMESGFERLLSLLNRTTDTIVGFKCPTGRLHPAFLFVPSKLITEKSNFAPNTPEHDHFGAFSESIMATDTPYKDLDTLIHPDEWEHLQGLTSNYDLLINGSSPSYKVNRFKEYNKRVLATDIDISEAFEEIIKKGVNL